MRVPSFTISPKAKKHAEVCQAYKKQFFEANGFLFCELCTRSNAYRYSVHHIRYASMESGHKELHNPKNLILLCESCHEDFHAGKLEKVRERLFKERGLKELFA